MQTGNHCLLCLPSAILYLQALQRRVYGKEELVIYTIIGNVITSLGAFITIYLTAIKDSHVSKLKTIREQLDKFYIPFYKIYCRGFLSELRLSELNFETWSCILDLMSDNLHLMEPESQSMYSKYYLAYLNMLEAQDGNPMFPVEQTSQNLDEAFNTLCRAIFREYVTLLRKLKLPVSILPTHKNSAL